MEQDDDGLGLAAQPVSESAEVAVQLRIDAGIGAMHLLLQVATPAPSSSQHRMSSLGDQEQTNVVNRLIQAMLVVAQGSSTEL
jgi:hypothetical protein